MTDQDKAPRTAKTSGGVEGQSDVTVVHRDGVQSIADQAADKLAGLSLVEMDDPGKLLRIIQDAAKAKSAEADAEGRSADARRKQGDGLDFVAARTEIERRLACLAQQISTEGLS